MKLPSKYILAVAAGAMILIFSYQCYMMWGLYKNRKTELEAAITQMMRTDDFSEMILRIKKIKGSRKENKNSISVDVSYSEKHSTINSNTDISISDTTGIDIKRLKKQLGDSTIIVVDSDSRREVSADSLEYYYAQSNGEKKKKEITNSQDIGFEPGKQELLKDMMENIQQGMHSSVDLLLEPDIAIYDSLITAHLKELGINQPHQLLLLKRKTDKNGKEICDTLKRSGTLQSPYPKKAACFNYTFSMNSNEGYLLIIDGLGEAVLTQMSGILASSLIILIVLMLSFWYLIHIILQQRTLEEMKSDFTNNVTHELKTPIAVAYAASDAMLNFKLGDDKEKRKKYLTVIQGQLEMLSGLVEQILSMSMERRKTFQLHWEEVQIEQMISGIAEQMKLKSTKEMEVRIEVTPSDMMARADKTHLRNILCNLIDNAMKYSKEKIEIKVTARKTDEGKNEITVTDNGIGIEKGNLPYLFDRFYRVQNGNIHNVKGYGLGLFYVKTMVEKMDGTVEVESRIEKGTTFRIRW